MKSIENESTKASYKISWELDKDPEPITSIISFRECVGEGSFSKVYRAKYKPTGLQVAVKVVPKRSFKTKKKRLLVQREVEILGSLDHPNIAGLFDVLEDSKNVNNCNKNRCT